jgi:UDP-N-acetylglucosamine:LPS N-acetylglucosamine transferase
VDAAVHHGGSGSIQTCIAADLASIAIPSHGEQDFNAHKLAELGLGRRVPVSDEPLERLALRDGFVTVGHREPRQLADRVAEALADLEPIEASAALPGADTAAEAITALALD